MKYDDLLLWMILFYVADNRFVKGLALAVMCVQSVFIIIDLTLKLVG